MSSRAAETQTRARQRWMSVLAKAEPAALARHWEALDPKPAYRIVRQPETGLVMVRGRVGGTGGPFNFGEMTVTRCAVALEEGPMGQAYVAGRNRDHVEIAAVFDALLQNPEFSEAIANGVIDSLESEQMERRRENGVKSAATKVDFFTMVRGED